MGDFNEKVVKKSRVCGEEESSGKPVFVEKEDNGVFTQWAQPWTFGQNVIF